MKKIVGILAAAALIATSVFAADVSAKVRIAGSIFEYDGSALSEDNESKWSPTGSFKLLRAATQSQPYWTPYITLSTSTDEAGAEVKFITGGDGTTDVSIDRSNVWFKPLDMLTIKAGFQGYNMHQEDIDYTNPTGAETWGYALSYAQDAISANVFLITGNNGWFFQDSKAAYESTKDGFGAYVNDLYVNAAYEADFGKITAMFEFQGKKWTTDKKDNAWENGEWKDITYEDGTDGTGATDKKEGTVFVKKTEKKTYNAQKIKFGAGYGNTIDNLSFWADAVLTMTAAPSDDEIKKLGVTPSFKDKSDPTKARSATGLFVDGYVKYAQDALTLRGYLSYAINDFGNWYENKDGEKKDSLTAKNNMPLGLKARVDYKLDNGINLFAYFGADNLLRKENTDAAKTNWDDASSVFVSTIKAGADGSVGILKWETYLQFDTGVNAEKPTGKTVKDEKDFGKYDKVKVSMPVTLTVEF
jgi:hypothetical protein